MDNNEYKEKVYTPFDWDEYERKSKIEKEKFEKLQKEIRET